MQKVNLDQLPEDPWTSPQGKFSATTRQVSAALGRDRWSTDLQHRHPFDLEWCRIPPGKANYPYHAHSAQWEFYVVISGQGQARDVDGLTPIAAGDAFLFKPGEPHQILNDSEEDLVLWVIADNPLGDTCHYPDSGKWSIELPERKIVTTQPADYFDGEE